MKSELYYLERELDRVLRIVEGLEEDIKKEKEKRAEKFDVRVVVETKGHGEWDWRRTVLVHLQLTLEQRNRMIGNLRWLEKVE